MIWKWYGQLHKTKKRKMSVSAQHYLHFLISRFVEGVDASKINLSTTVSKRMEFSAYLYLEVSPYKPNIVTLGYLKNNFLLFEEYNKLDEMVSLEITNKIVDMGYSESDIRHPIVFNVEK